MSNRKILIIDDDPGIRTFAVVINGPDASAGFMPNLSNNNGVIVPMIEANKTTPNRAMDTTSPSFNGCPISKLKKSTNIASTIPFINDTNKPLINL